MHSVTLFLDAFVTALIIYLLQRTEWKTLLFKWAWIWKHGRIHTILLMNILNRWIIKVPNYELFDVDVTNKDILDVMDENILESSWSKNSLAFRLAIEMSSTSKLDFYILDAPVSNRLIIKQGVSECLNISTAVEHMIPFTSF